MTKELTKWADSIINTINRPKFTQKNMVYDPKNGCTVNLKFTPPTEPAKPLPCFFSERKIIGFHGPLQSGKDSSASVLIEEFGFKKLAFADALRTSLYKLNPIVATGLDGTLIKVQDIVNLSGWDYAKTIYPEVRRLLQVLGTESGRDIHGQNCWTDIVARQFEENLNQNFVVTDVRFPNEVELIHDYEGVVIRVEREGTAPSESHASEQFLPNCDYVIQNNGTLEELRQKVIDIVFPKVIKDTSEIEKFLEPEFLESIKLSQETKAKILGID